MLIPPEFFFSLAVLILLRVARSLTWLVFGLSTLLSVTAVGLDSYSHPHPQLFVWLGAAGWVCTLRGSKEPVWLIFLLPHLTWVAGWLGVLTGVALNSPLPRKKSPPPKETYGIYRIR